MILISKCMCILLLILTISHQSTAQHSTKKQKKIITISSTEDLSEVDKIFAPNMNIDRTNKETPKTEEDKALEALAAVYIDAQKENDALEQEQEQLVDWYFDSPATINETTPSPKQKKKKEAISRKK
ncbi:MAG: hypothetical protein GY810_21780 [Aureispira sp.]|nr:hypothetical protein [Aureispira sp.]